MADWSSSTNWILLKCMKSYDFFQMYQFDWLNLTKSRSTMLNLKEEKL